MGSFPFGTSLFRDVTGSKKIGSFPNGKGIKPNSESLKGSVFEALICIIIRVLSIVMSLRCRVDLRWYDFTVGAVYSELRKKPKKAKADAAQNIVLSNLLTYDELMYDLICLSVTTKMGIRGYRCPVTPSFLFIPLMVRWS